MEKNYQAPRASIINIETCDIIATSTGNLSKKQGTAENTIEGTNYRGWGSLWENQF